MTAIGTGRVQIQGVFAVLAVVALGVLPASVAFRSGVVTRGPLFAIAVILVSGGAFAALLSSLYEPLGRF